MNSLKKFVCFTFAIVLVHTEIFICIYLIKGSIPDTLVQMFYTVFGVELLMCMVKAIINKRSKDGTD